MTPLEITCQRRGEPGAPGCEHSLHFCTQCAWFACQTCWTEDQDARAIADEQNREYWA